MNVVGRGSQFWVVGWEVWSRGGVGLVQYGVCEGWLLEGWIGVGFLREGLQIGGSAGILGSG